MTSIASLMSAAANRIMRITATKPNSDSYLLDEVMPSISDDQFAAVIGMHGFVLVNDLTVDPKTQVLEGILQHQEIELSVGLQIRGSYTRDQDGEWSVQVNVMGAEDDEPLVDHQPFSFDPETDAVGLMKSVAHLLAELSDLEGPDEPEDEENPEAPPIVDEAPAPPASPEPSEEPPAPSGIPEGAEPPPQKTG